jgi:uncharacterized membrane protein
MASGTRTKTRSKPTRSSSGKSANASNGRTKAKNARTNAKPRAADPPPQESAGDYAKQALAEWGQAARLGAAALATRRAKRAAEGPGVVRRAGGAAADWALARLGPVGKAASKLSLGRKVLAGGSEDPEPTDTAPEGDGSDGDELAAIPIQQSIEIAVPAELAYRLALGFEDYPLFLKHVRDVVVHGDEVEFEARLRGSGETIAIEVFDVRENERIDWRATGGPEHAGTASFHPLAPRLTHVELSIDSEPQGLVQRITRALHISHQTVHGELQRFKAYAELYEEPDDGERDVGDEPAEGEDERDEA